MRQPSSGWSRGPWVAVAAAVMGAALAGEAAAGWGWYEGEKPASSTMRRHPWYDSVKRDQLSGGDTLSHFDPAAPAEATYRLRLSKAGSYEFWVRANPVQAKLSYRLNGATEWTPINLERGQTDQVNIAADGKPDLRFLAWVDVGRVELASGENVVRFRMDSSNSNHGYLDCFVFTDEPFRPRGALKPDQLAAASRRDDEAQAGWFAFDPPADRFAPESGIDLRGLNEKQAGDGGPIGVRGDEFVHTTSGEPLRFWAVNGPADADAEGLRRQARMLAKRGVNLVRVHHGYYDGKTGTLDPAAVQKSLEVIEAMKAEGIYTHFSIYFPLWLTPAPGTSWLQGYDGQQHPFAALMFNPDFQEKYRGWWKALLTTPHARTSKRLVDDPAVMGLEIQNEDSFFFWTFDAKNIADPQLRILEAKFGDWLKAKHGSIEGAMRAWGGRPLERDRPAEGRVAFRPLWNVANERTARDKDTVRFLVETQRGFYKETADFLRSQGFKGLITCSNWTTASAEVLGPLEKYTYTAGDFIDRHGYFGCGHGGDNAAWSIRDGHTYTDRSALRFDSEAAGKPKLFAHPAFDPSYAGKPSMISETTWTRPNRYRTEAALYYAAYGALQGSDGIVHFALDAGDWSVKPRFFMQPWTLMSPTMMGQFPAAALIYRKGLVAPGETLVDLDLKLGDLLDLKGTPMPQDAALDELRLADVPKAQGGTLPPGGVIDPLVHLAGRTAVRFTERGGTTKLADLSKLIDRAGRKVTSSTGELRLDYGKGVLTIDAPAAQGVVGALGAAGPVETKDLTIASGLEVGSMIAVALDGKPLASSGRILLQVMSEEQPTGFLTEPSGDGAKRIASIGQDPWRVRLIEGRVKFKRADAGNLKAQALDHNGEPAREMGAANEITLDPKTLYYLITR